MDIAHINSFKTLLSIIVAIKNVTKQRKKQYLIEREMIEKRIRAKKLLAAQILRNMRRRTFQRSCLVQPELTLNIIGKYWEQQVPLYTGNIHNS